MFLDLDHFKYVNTSMGHSVGDQLLSIAPRLTGAVLNSDTVYRLGGDEFVIILADVEHAPDAVLSAQKTLTALTAPHRIGQLELHITISTDISVYADNGQPQCLELELTGSVLMHAANTTNAVLNDLKTLGVWLTIDAFGTGYSSLSYLKHFQIDSWKSTSLFCATSPTQARIALMRPLSLLWCARGKASTSA